MTARLWDANASFSSTRSRSPTVSAGAFQQLADGRHRPDAHHARIDARNRTADEPAERFDAQSCSPLFARDHECGGAVVDAARVAGGDRAAFAEYRLEGGELLRARVGTWMLVPRQPVDGDRALRRSGPTPQRLPSAAESEARKRPGPRARRSSARRRSRPSRPSTRAGRARRVAGSGSATRAACRIRSRRRRRRASRARAARGSSTRPRRRRRGRRHRPRSRATPRSPRTVPKRRDDSRSRRRRSPAGPRAGPPCARRCGCPRPPGWRRRNRRPRSPPGRRPRAQPPRRSPSRRDRPAGRQPEHRPCARSACALRRG